MTALATIATRAGGAHQKTGRRRTRQERRVAERSGRIAETLAALWLMAKGYRILAERARTPWGEIDLVARKGDLLTFVEVKRRRRQDDAIAAVGGQSRHRIIQAAQAWAGKARLHHLIQRYDIIAMTPGSWPKHVCDGFREGDWA